MENEEMFKGLIEQMTGLNNEEIQSVEVKSNKDKQNYWTIKAYGKVDDAEKLVVKVVNIDRKLKDTFYAEANPIEDVSIEKCNRFTEPVAYIELVRSAKHQYTWNIKYQGRANQELGIVDRIQVLDTQLKGYFPS